MIYLDTSVLVALLANENSAPMIRQWYAESNTGLLLTALANNQPLVPRHRDHDLIGNWVGLRECHVKPDLRLIYSKPDDDTRALARFGSHSELSSIMSCD